jgi:hypothetical protein
VPNDDEEHAPTVTALDDAYDRGVANAQSFIDRHPHGWPAVVMSQDRKPTWPANEVDREYMRGYYDRFEEEIGTEEDPTESWKEKMQSFDQWPDEVEG